MGRSSRWGLWVAIGLAFAVLTTCCSWRGDKDTGAKPDARDVGTWFEPLIPAGPATVSELCSIRCVVGSVVLPGRFVVETAVDLPMPETTGALSVERIWTGQRGALFGSGWESVWDIRLSEGRLTGPIPDVPVTEPGSGSAVNLADGTSLSFDNKGRPVRICSDGALCTTAKWSRSGVALVSGGRSVRLELNDGRVRSARSNDGREIKYAYDDDLLITADDGPVRTRYSYEHGQLSRIDGPETRGYEYQDGSVVAVTNGAGERWSFTQGADDEVAMTVPDGDTVTYGFSGRKLISETSSRDGLLLKREYDSQGLILERLPRDRVTMTRVSLGTFQVEQRLGSGATRRSKFTIDELGRMTRNESGDGAVEIKYDGRSSRVLRNRRGEAETKFEYDDHGLLVASEDADGYRVELTRDEAGQITALSDGLLRTDFAYDASGNPTTEATAGRKTTATFDSEGNVNAIELPQGVTIPAEHDDASTEQASGGQGIQTVLDQLDQLATSLGDSSNSAVHITEQKAGIEVRYSDGRTALFDDWGRLLRLKAGESVVSRSYDANGRITDLTMPDGRTYSLEHTPAGRVASVSDGVLNTKLSWHGELLTAATTSMGTSYKWDYDGAGRLTSSKLGDALWTYHYDLAGNVDQIATPSGIIRYEWDDWDRPVRTMMDGHITEYTWLDQGMELMAVADPLGDTVKFERDKQGHVTAMETPDGASTFEYPDGRLGAYQIGDAARVEIARNSDGRVQSLTYDGVTENWSWVDGQVRRVTVDGDTYDLEWLANGALGRLSKSGADFLRVSTDSAGRITSIDGDDGSSAGTFKWSPAGLSRADVGDYVFAVERDDESKPVKVESQGSTTKIEYKGGIPVRVRGQESSVTSKYEQGRLTSSTFESGEQQIDVMWDSTGRPTSFKGRTDDGEFRYKGDRLASLTYAGKEHPVGYSDAGDPSGDSMVRAVVDRLFAGTGTFTAPTDGHLTAPPTPWLDGLPTELGIDVPVVTTATDIVTDSLDRSIPNLDVPVRPDTDAARRAAEQVVMTYAPSSVPLAADRVGELSLGFESMPTTQFDASVPQGIVALALTDYVVDQPNAVQKVTKVGTHALLSVARAPGAVARFLLDETIGRFLLATGIVVLSAALCPTPACSVAVYIGGPLVTALITGEADDLPSAISVGLVDPARDLATGVVNLDPIALLTVALTVMPVVGKGARPVLRRVSQSKLAGRLCGLKRVVCVSVSEFGEAGQHVLDAQWAGHSRILKLDRSGSVARRTERLKGVARRVGLDRDEYPWALAEYAKPPSIKYVDPTSNRSLGAYIRHQLSGLPDGSRFFVYARP